MIGATPNATWFNPSERSEVVWTLIPVVKTYQPIEEQKSIGSVRHQRPSGGDTRAEDVLQFPGAHTCKLNLGRE